MKYIKSIKTSLLIIFICFCTFCSGYTMGSSFVYADSNTDNWTQVTTNAQLVEAFRYYCKSRDLTIDGSIADGVTRFTTSAFNGICNTLGIDVTALQAQIKYQTDGNIGTRFLFTALGIDAYNRIFAQFLQDNDIDVGDSVDKIVESNLWWEDDYHNGCYCLITNGGLTSNFFTNHGSAYLNMDWGYFEPLKNPETQTMTLLYKGNTYTYYRITEAAPYYYRSCLSKTTDYGANIALFRPNDAQNSQILGYATVRYDLIDHKYYFGYVNSGGSTFVILYELTDGSSTEQTVYITTNNTVINNNVYEGDTIINNNGIPSEPEIPIPDPEPDYQPAENWDIDLPDLSIPNWIISGKENKFPFDIPFNVMYALSLLQAEPEAPRLEGTLDFGFYEWEYDLDLSDFDPVAEICRNMEVLVFITGLMLMTRKLIWG